jgi:hypothetical protein
LAELIRPIGQEGVEARNGRNKSAAADELYRFTLRYEANAAWDPRVADGLAQIRSHIESDARPTARTLLRALLTGTRRDGAPQADAIDDYSSALAESLFCVATLVADARFDWQPHENESGQIRVPEAQLNVLVWSDTELSGRQIIRELQAWSRSAGEHPPLLVLARGARTSLEMEGAVGTGDRRTSIDEPPSRPGDLGVEAGDFTIPRGYRKVFSARLERVASFYEDDANDAAAFEQLVSALLELCHV